VVAVFKMIALWVPALILVVGGIAAMGFPLDRRRHALVLRRLERQVRHGG
jgi:Na+/melibiose symporter-like transporter